MAKKKEKQNGKLDSSVDWHTFMEEQRKRPRINISPSLDYYFNGGLPMPCVAVVAGTAGLGKTTICLQLGLLTQQQLGWPIFVFDAEGRARDHIDDQLRACGIVDANIRLIRGEKDWTLERWLTELTKYIKAYKESIFIFDAIGGLPTAAELTRKDDDKIPIGSAARRLNLWFREIANTPQHQNQFLMMIAHVYKNPSPGQKTNVPKISTGIMHGTDLMLQLNGRKFWTTAAGKKPMGQQIYAEIIKNPGSAPAGISFEIPFRFGVGIDSYKDVVDHAVVCGFIERAEGSSWYVLNLPSFKKGADEIKLQGDKAVIKWLKAHPKPFMELKDQISKLITAETDE